MFGYPTRAELDDVHDRDRAAPRAARALKRERRAETPARPVARQAPPSGKRRARRRPVTHASEHRRPIKPARGDRRGRRSRQEDRRRREAVRRDAGRGRAIATTPKDEVWRAGQGHALPLPAARRDARSQTPVLIVYGLIGRYTMADLQEDRSLVRNLLELGVDLYVVDWGNPSRADRWLTIDDYVDGYLADCVARHRRARTASTRSTCSASAKAASSRPATRRCTRRRVKNMVLTITPIDFHGDTVREPARPRLHQHLDAQPRRPRTSTG